MNSNNDICCICLDDFKKNSSVIQVECCNGKFHTNCLWKWQCIKDNCPLCRYEENNQINNFNKILLKFNSIFLKK
jgi:hypothetical protein